MYIKVHVLPESSEESVTKKGEVVYVAVKEKAKAGAANRRMLTLIRGYLGGGRKRITIVSGHHAPHKILSVD